MDQHATSAQPGIEIPTPPRQDNGQGQSLTTQILIVPSGGTYRATVTITDNDRQTSGRFVPGVFSSELEAWDAANAMLRRMVTRLLHVVPDAPEARD